MKGIYMLNSCSAYLIFVLPVRVYFQLNLSVIFFFGFIVIKGQLLPLQGVVVVSQTKL